MAKNIVFTKDAPAPIGPYNQAIWAGNTLFLSGQIAINPKTGELIDKSQPIEEETHQVMKNLAAVLKAAGLSFNDVIKTCIFLDDMNSFGRVNAVYGEYFEEGQAPARETVEVANLPKFVRVEISMIAYK